MAREVYDDRLVLLKRRPAPSLSRQCSVDDNLDAYSVSFCYRTHHLVRVVVDKRD
jgi:hypothetical protein